MNKTVFITTATARDLTNKSQSSISNFCRKYKDTKHVKKVGKSYFIDRNFLLTIHKPLVTPSEISNTSLNKANIQVTEKQDKPLIKNEYSELKEIIKKLELEKITHLDQLKEHQEQIKTLT